MNAQIKALIVDDEPLARTALATLLAEHGQVEIIGMAGCVKEARALLALHTPDLVFLDMEMPGGSGLELEPFLPASTRTIFVTAFSDYALRAFEFGASDYLVKPVDAQRLEIALGRLDRRLPVREVTTGDGSLILEVDGKTTRVKMAEILWIRAQQNYSVVRIMGGGVPLMVPKSMADWESVLPPAIFERLDRSAIVNVKQIQTVSWLSRDETLVAFSNESGTLRLGRTAAQRLKGRLATEA
jgi:two-component system, LytTR family, response regulator